jgi:hypothetical protein
MPLLSLILCPSPPPLLLTCWFSGKQNEKRERERERKRERERESEKERESWSPLIVLCRPAAKDPQQKRKKKKKGVGVHGSLNWLEYIGMPAAAA